MKSLKDIKQTSNRILFILQWKPSVSHVGNKFRKDKGNQGKYPGERKSRSKNVGLYQHCTNMGNCESCEKWSGLGQLKLPSHAKDLYLKPSIFETRMTPRHCPHNYKDGVTSCGNGKTVGRVHLERCSSPGGQGDTLRVSNFCHGSPYRLNIRSDKF